MFPYIPPVGNAAQLAGGLLNHFGNAILAMKSAWHGLNMKFAELLTDISCSSNCVVQRTIWSFHNHKIECGVFETVRLTLQQMQKCFCSGLSICAQVFLRCLAVVDKCPKQASADVVLLQLRGRCD